MAGRMESLPWKSFQRNMADCLLAPSRTQPVEGYIEFSGSPLARPLATEGGRCQLALMSGVQVVGLLRQDRFVLMVQCGQLLRVHRHWRKLFKLGQSR